LVVLLVVIAVVVMITVMVIAVVVGTVVVALVVGIVVMGIVVVITVMMGTVVMGGLVVLLLVPVVVVGLGVVGLIGLLLEVASFLGVSSVGGGGGLGGGLELGDLLLGLLEGHLEGLLLADDVLVGLREALDLVAELGALQAVLPELLLELLHPPLEGLDHLLVLLAALVRGDHHGHLLLRGEGGHLRGAGPAVLGS
jgi:hypothetical protein